MDQNDLLTPEDVESQESMDLELPSLFKAWFVFAALVTLAVLVGGAYVVYLLLDHFGVIMAGVPL